MSDTLAVKFYKSKKLYQKNRLTYSSKRMIANNKPLNVRLWNKIQNYLKNKGVFVYCIDIAIK